MMLLRSTCLGLLFAAGIAASPVRQSAVENDQEVPVRRELISSPSGNGTHDGYFWTWWSDNSSPQEYTNKPGGAYSVKWQSPGNFVGGKGWTNGHRRNITYSADWKPVNNSNSYLMIYGLAKSARFNPRDWVEYYIIESHGSYNPGSDAAAKGEVKVDGATYKLYQLIRYGLPGIPGTPTVVYYYAIRQQQRTKGTVDTSKIFDAWAAANLTITDHVYQIVGTEGYWSAGTSNVRVLTPP
jgi:endo-1,4-beta-xylanase